MADPRENPNMKAELDKAMGRKTADTDSGKGDSKSTQTSKPTEEQTQTPEHKFGADMIGHLKSLLNLNGKEITEGTPPGATQPEVAQTAADAASAGVKQAPGNNADY